MFLPKGSTTQYDGFLFDVPRAQELRKIELEHKTYQLLNDSLTTTVNEQNNIISQNGEKVKLLTDQNDKLAKELMDSRQSSEFTKILWFGLGVIITGAAFYGASKITQH